MKTVAYVVAGLAALGIMIALIVSPTAEVTPSETAPPAASLVSTTSEPMAEPGSMTFEVPGMHCQFACFPRVKETLESGEGVSEVVLAEQPDPNALTVKKVIVKYDTGFDPGKAIAALKQKGFNGAQQIQ